MNLPDCPHLMSVEEAIERLAELVAVGMHRPGQAAADGAAVPILLGAAQAGALCGVSERTWRTWDAGGLVPRPVAVGRSKFWRTDEIRQWVARGCPRRDIWDAQIDGESA